MGRAIGGGSSIHAITYARGHKADYGSAGLTWNAILEAGGLAASKTVGLTISQNWSRSTRGVVLPVGP